ncbi:MAG: AAA family ATPase [Holosporales bacterium]|jgi:DNA replication and repair protein RecF|nr:AAA family ATPase [Holosporales bacterium]
MPDVTRLSEESAWEGMTSLSLIYFRNYKKLRLEVEARNVLLTGPNGAGKTSVLEALSLFSPSKGLRQAALTELRTMTAPALSPWSVSTRVRTAAGLLDLGTGGEMSAIPERRIAKIHHKFIRSFAAFEEVLWILWLTPSMDRLFTEASHKQRAFFDHLVGGLYPSYKTRHAHYKALLKERLRLLLFYPSETSWIASVEEKLARLGAEMTRTRRAFLDLLTSRLPTVSTPFPCPTVQLRETYPADGDLEDSLQKALAAHRAQDAQTGNTAAGPHRTEWVARFPPKGLLASSCSTGEQKALLLTLILATARLYKERRTGVPLLLFDDCTTHLDAQKQAALWEALQDLHIQMWFTSVETPNFPATGENLQHFSVENGICQRKTR